MSTLILTLAVLGAVPAYAGNFIIIPDVQRILDLPTVAKPIQWKDSAVLVVERSGAPITPDGQVSKLFNGAFYGKLSIPVRILASSFTGPASSLPSLTLTMGNRPPEDRETEPATKADCRYVEPLFPASQPLLILVTKKPDQQWSEVAPLEPRMLFPTTRRVIQPGGSTRDRTFLTLADTFQYDKDEVVQGEAEWMRRVEDTSPRPGFQPVDPDSDGHRRQRPAGPPPPPDPTWSPLAKATKSMASHAPAWAAAYLFLLAEHWGDKTAINNYFEACYANAKEARAPAWDAMDALNTYRGRRIKGTDAVAMARRMKTPVAGYFLSRFPDWLEGMTNEDRQALFQYCPSLDVRARVWLYSDMATMLPNEFRRVGSPDCLLAETDSTGTYIMDEEGLRARWAKYLGLPAGKPPWR